MNQTEPSAGTPERRQARSERRFGFTRRFSDRRRRSVPVTLERRVAERRTKNVTRRSGADRRGFLGLRRPVDFQ